MPLLPPCRYAARYAIALMLMSAGCHGARYAACRADDSRFDVSIDAAMRR